MGLEMRAQTIIVSFGEFPYFFRSFIKIIGILAINTFKLLSPIGIVKN